jgi:hypothetical protein
MSDMASARRFGITFSELRESDALVIFHEEMIC